MIRVLYESARRSAALGLTAQEEAARLAALAGHRAAPLARAHDEAVHAFVRSGLTLDRRTAMLLAHALLLAQRVRFQRS